MVLESIRQYASYLRYFWFFRDEVSPLRVFRSGYLHLVELIRNDGKSYRFDSLIFEVTSRCRLNCTFCYYVKKKNRHVSELSLQEITSFLDTIKRHRPSIVLSGGEPFERKDILEIIDRVKERKFPCTIVTNAYTIDTKSIRHIIDSGVESVIISLHGSEKQHDRITQVPGSFEKVLATVKEFTKVKNRKTKIILNYVIHDASLESLEEVAKIAKETDVDLLKIEHLQFVEKSDNPTQETTYENSHPKIDGSSLYEKLQQLRRENVPMLVKPSLSKQETIDWYAKGKSTKRECLFSYRSFILGSDGTVYPCQYYYEAMGNITKTHIVSIWNNPRYMQFRKRIQKHKLPYCKRCCKT